MRRSDGPCTRESFESKVCYEARMPSDTSRSPLPRGRRVLLVDDDADAVEMLSQLLRSAGHEVRGVTDPDAALAEVDSFRPDVAVVDIGLPTIDGYELARRIRERTPCRLLALSGYSAETAPADTSVTVFDEHLVKPVELSVLLRCIGSAAR